MLLMWWYEQITKQNRVFNFNSWMCLEKSKHQKEKRLVSLLSHIVSEWVSVKWVSEWVSENERASEWGLVSELLSQYKS